MEQTQERGVGTSLSPQFSFSNHHGGICSPLRGEDERFVLRRGWQSLAWGCQVPLCVGVGASRCSKSQGKRQEEPALRASQTGDSEDQALGVGVPTPGHRPKGGQTLTREEQGLNGEETQARKGWRASCPNRRLQPESRGLETRQRNERSAGERTARLRESPRKSEGGTAEGHETRGCLSIASAAAPGGREGGGGRGRGESPRTALATSPAPRGPAQRPPGPPRREGTRRVPPASGEEAALPTGSWARRPGTGVTLGKEGPPRPWAQTSPGLCNGSGAPAEARPAGHPPSDPQGRVVQQDTDNVQQAGEQLQGEVEQPDPQACEGEGSGLPGHLGSHAASLHTQDPPRGQRVLCVVGVLLGHPERWERGVATPLTPWGRIVGVWGARPWARTQGHDLHAPPGTPGGGLSG